MTERRPWTTHVGESIARRLKPVVERQPHVARLYRELRERRRWRADPQATPFGFRFCGYPSMIEGTFEPEETALFRRLVSHADLFVNVGANIGYYTCLALAAGVQTIAIEPLPGNLRYLFRNLRANGWDDRIEVYPVAVSGRPGLVELFGEGTGASLVRGWAGASDASATIVPATTLDLLLGNRLHGRQSLLVVDVEGAEHQVLSGASAVLRAVPRPAWLIEITFEHHQPAGVRINPHLQSTFETFWNAGYDAFSVGDALRCVSRDEVAEAIRTGRNRLAAHNFLFIESGRRSAWLNASTTDG